MNKKIILFFLVIFFQNLNAQKTDDSLLNLIKNSKIDTIKVKAYIELSWLNSFLNPDLACNYAKTALEISTKIDYTLGIIDANNRIGSAYHNKGENITAMEYLQKSYDIAFENNNLLKQSIALSNMAGVFENSGLLEKAIDYYNKSLEIEIKLKNKEGIASEYLGLGNTYKEMGDFTKAMEYLFKSLTIREELNNKQDILNTLLSIGALYFTMNKLDLALSYFNRVYKISTEIGDSYSAASVLLNIGGIYVENGKIDSALMIYNKGIEICQKNSDFYTLSHGYTSLARIYFIKSDINIAIEYNQKSLDIRQKIDDISGVIHCYVNFGNIYSSVNKIDLAIKYVQMAIDISKEKKIALSHEYAEGFISKLYANKKDFENAYKHHLRYKEISDSLSINDNVKKMTQLEMQYEFDKIQKLQAFEQEQKEITQKAELSKQKILRNSFIFGFMLMILFAYVMFKSYRRKKKDNLLLTFQNQEIRQQKEEISAQRDEIETQRDLVTKQKEHIEEIHKDVSDSINYAKRIQEAMLPDLSSKFQAPNSKFQEEEIKNKKQEMTNESTATAASNIKHQTSNIFILFRPKDVVSGDFYWFSKVNDYLIYAVADCTGHGVPGAFMSMLGVSFLNEIVRRKEVTQASYVLDQLRNSIIDALKQNGKNDKQNISNSLNIKDGMDISLVVIKYQVQNPKFQEPSEEESEQSANNEHITTNNKHQTSNTLHAQWAGANNPLWLIRNNSNFPNFENLENLVEIKPDKMPIAIYEKMAPFTNHEFTLYSGDTIYLMSDGYQDQFGGENGKKFLSKNLKELIIANCLLTMEEQKQIFETTLDNWIGNSEQIDDITILGIKI